MNTSKLHDTLQNLSKGLWVYPTMSADSEEWEYTLKGGDSDRLLPPSEWSEYFENQNPCIGLEYGGGSYIHVLPTKSCPPEVLEFLAVEGNHDWENWTFDPALPYLVVDLSASGDVVESLSDVSERSLRLAT